LLVTKEVSNHSDHYAFIAWTSGDGTWFFISISETAGYTDAQCGTDKVTASNLTQGH
jgi:hypothetical protein